MKNLNLKRTQALLIALLFTVTSFCGYSQHTKDYSKLLPGVVKVSEYLYYDKTEITNLSWLEYLHWLRKTNDGRKGEDYLNALPDTALWSVGLDSIHPYEKFYLRHPAYRDYPVVGVTWKQATEYCAWRSQRVEEYMVANGVREKAPTYFAYRLPSYDEFLMMYDDIAHLSDQIGEEGKRKYRGRYRFNMHKAMNAQKHAKGNTKENADVTAPGESYWPNSYGVFNMRGNVSEWVASPNGFAGGSWKDSFSDDVRSMQVIDDPSISRGFRCVCEIANEAP